MVDRLACPGAARLTGLLDAPDPSGEVLDHLARCRRCQEELERLAAGESAWLRDAPTGGAGDRPAELRETIDALKRGPLPGDAGTAVDLPPDYLGPSDHPGALGAVGPYPVLEVIGRGGMGVVFKALDPALGRVVAVKVLAPQWAASGTARQRFTREARAAAAVAHEHVVSIHAVDEANGLPYLVMECVPGPSLQERIDRDGPLDPKDAVRVALQTAEGLAAAHRQGLVHRDVKPANILLENGVGRARLTDFGLARAVDDAGCTQHGTIAGTPEYMAPEQAAGQPVDHRADLYSLGCVVYAACTGRPPFRAATSLGVIHLAATTVPPPVRSINPDVPRDLDEVVGRLMARDPADRYPTAEEAAGALRQVLVRMLRPDLRPAPRWLGRRGVQAAAVLLAGLAAAVVPAVRPRDGVPPPESPPAQPEAAAPPAGAPDPPGEAAEPGVPAPALLREFAGHTGSVRAVVVRPDGKRMASVTGWPRGDGTLRVWDVATGREGHRIPVGNVHCDALTLTPDGGTLVAGCSDGSVRLYEWDGEAELVRLRGRAGEGLWLSGWDGGPGGAPPRPPPAEVHWVAVSPAAGTRRVATALSSGEVNVWDAATARLLWHAPHTRNCRVVAFSPDGRTLASCSVDGTVKFWAADTGTPLKQVYTPHGTGEVWALAFADGGRWVVTGGTGAAVWDVATGQLVARLRGHTYGVTSLAVSPDGTRVVTTALDRTARVWDVATGRPLYRIPAGVGAVWGATFTPDGRAVLTCGGAGYDPPTGTFTAGPDFTIRMWAVDGPPTSHPPDPPARAEPGRP